MCGLKPNRNSNITIRSPGMNEVSQNLYNTLFCVHTKLRVALDNIYYQRETCELKYLLRKILKYFCCFGLSKMKKNTELTFKLYQIFIILVILLKTTLKLKITFIFTFARVALECGLRQFIVVYCVSLSYITVVMVG